MEGTGKGNGIPYSKTGDRDQDEVDALFLRQCGGQS